MLADADTVVFDKTGTLTRGVFAVTKVIPADGVREDELLELAALAEALFRPSHCPLTAGGLRP